jgi:O-antigen/teichoic acid export membrane protein
VERSLEAADSASPHIEYVSLIAKGAAIVFAGTIAGGALRYLFQVLVARHIGVESFGLFSLGLAVFNVAVMIASLGMGQGVVRFVSLYQAERDRRRVKGTSLLAAALALVGGSVVGLLLVIVSRFLAVDVFDTSDLTPVLRFFAVGVPFFALTTVFLSSTQGLRIMKYRVYVRDLFELLSRIALATVAFLLGWKLLGAIVAFVASIIAGTLLSFLFYRRVFGPILTPRIRSILEPRRFLAFCWPLFFADGFNFTEAWISTFVLGYYATPEAVGVFSAAYRTSLLVQGLLTSFNTMFAPIISDLHHTAELRKLESLFKMVTKWAFSLGFPAVALIVIFPREILTVFGQDFAGGGISLIVLGLGQLMNLVTGPLGVMISMSGRSRLTMLNAVLHLLLQAGLCFLLIPGYGVLGAAVAKVLSIAFLRMMRLLQVRLLLGMHPFRRTFLKPVLAGGVSWLLLSLARTSIQTTASPAPWLILGSLSFLIVYGLVLTLLGFDEEDRMLFQKIRTRFAS